PVPWSILGDTAQGLLNQDEGVVEHYEARNEGVEVSWVFSQRPFGSGPLEIDAQLTGLQYVGQTDTGHHFADSQGTPRVQVGNAVAVDARGIRTELPFRADGGTLHLELSARFLSEAAFPLAIDPTIGPEFGMGVCMQ